MSDNVSNVSKFMCQQMARVSGDNAKLRQRITRLTAQIDILRQILRSAIVAGGKDVSLFNLYFKSRVGILSPFIELVMAKYFSCS